MIITIYIVLFIIVIVLFIWQSSNLISAFLGAPAVMMDRKVIIGALKLAKVEKGDIFYDLGCGNGQVLIEAAKMGAKATGFEVSPYYYILSKWRTAKYKNIEVKYRNINSIDLSKANVVYCYLLPKILNKILFKKGNRLVSIGFKVINKKPEKIIKVKSHSIFYYRY